MFDVEYYNAISRRCNFGVDNTKTPHRKHVLSSASSRRQATASSLKYTCTYIM